jgi:pilus assembly protein CpaB
MNLKTVIPLVVALALAIVAAKLGKDIMSRRHDQNTSGAKMIKLVVAKEDLMPGSAIQEGDLVLRDMPADALSDSAFRAPAEVVGRVVLSQIVKGQVVLTSFLAPKGTTGGAQAMVPEGMRAITLEVNEFSGVAGLLTPGSHVDLVQTIQSKDDKAGPMAKTLVENLKVIAVGRRLGNPPAANGDVDPPMVRSVTLLATTEQAVTIDLASHVGSPRLVLRNTMDDKHNDAKGVTVAELRGADESASDNKLTDMMAQLLLSGPTTKPVETNVEPVVKPVVKNYREVEVIRAGASSNVRVTVSRNNEAISTTADKLLEDDSED